LRFDPINRSRLIGSLIPSARARALSLFRSLHVDSTEAGAPSSMLLNLISPAGVRLACSHHLLPACTTGAASGSRRPLPRPPPSQPTAAHSHVAASRTHPSAICCSGPAASPGACPVAWSPVGGGACRRQDCCGLPYIRCASVVWRSGGGGLEGGANSLAVPTRVMIAWHNLSHDSISPLHHRPLLPPSPRRPPSSLFRLPR
jgi:hypothetical protein